MSKMASGRKARLVRAFERITGASPTPNQGVETTPRRGAHTIPHPFAGSIQEYSEAISDPDCDRPYYCPQCGAKQPLAGRGFYHCTLVDPGLDGVMRVRRNLCRFCTAWSMAYHRF